MPNTYVKIDEMGLDPSDPLPVLRCTFKGDNPYHTGGFTAFTAFVQQQTGRGTHPFDVRGFGDGGGAAYLLDYDNLNDALIVRLGTTGVEVADNTDLSNVVFRATIWAK